MDSFALDDILNIFNNFYRSANTTKLSDCTLSYLIYLMAII